MKLYASGEDYLDAMLVIQKENDIIHCADVAWRMEVSKPSVTNTVSGLRFTDHLET